MKNQNTEQQKRSVAQTKKENYGNVMTTTGLGLGIIVIFLMMYACACASTSRPSTPPEIAEQMKFQEKWNTAKIEAEQQWDSTLSAEQKLESIGK